ncbi:hypothetical protein ABT369_47715 [Dactylosporangium sp. NPDC000244]|uniref:hypothetical protein n=1 Tax=Dactylosporangium sp. NPDC000244 TaxID=3154365 RepID=UPI003329F6AA
MGRLFGLMILWAGAVFWAVGLTRLQSLTEPVGEEVASNNTYWARDLRWMAIVAVAVAFVVAARSSAAGLGRVRSWCLVAGFTVVVAADLVCDRLDVTATIRRRFPTGRHQRLEPDDRHRRRRAADHCQGTQGEPWHRPS